MGLLFFNISPIGTLYTIQCRVWNFIIPLRQTKWRPSRFLTVKGKRSILFHSLILWFVTTITLSRFTNWIYELKRNSLLNITIISFLRVEVEYFSRLPSKRSLINKFSRTTKSRIQSRVIPYEVEALKKEKEHTYHGRNKRNKRKPSVDRCILFDTRFHVPRRTMSALCRV